MTRLEERYEDCDRCGERYHGEDIGRWLRDEKRTPSKHFDETWRVCCEGRRSTEGLIEGRYSF